MLRLTNTLFLVTLIFPCYRTNWIHPSDITYVNKQKLSKEYQKILNKKTPSQKSDFVRKQCEVYKNHPQIQETQKITNLWNSVAINQTKARNITKWDPYHLLGYFEDKRKTIDQPRNVISCLPPKSGCSSWQVLMVEQLWNQKVEFIEGGDRPMSFNRIVSSTLLFNFVKYSRVTLKKFMDDLRYDTHKPVRFMHTRHPIARLYSLWSDKFVLKNLPTNPSEKTRNQAKAKHFLNIGRNFERYMNLTLPTYEDRHDELKKHPGWLVSFSGLLNFIVSGRLFVDDIHWRPMAKICGPCSINYDYITQLETITDDIKIISKELNLPKNTKFPEMNKKAGATFENQSQKLARIYFEKKISREVLDKVYEKYFLDFELFGYSFEEFMMEYNKLA